MKMRLQELMLRVFLYYNIVTGRNVNATTLTGKGTAIAVLDSGVDYRHPDFRNVDGSTRILAYWDQSLPFCFF